MEEIGIAFQRLFRENHVPQKGKSCRRRRVLRTALVSLSPHLLLLPFRTPSRSAVWGLFRDRKARENEINEIEEGFPVEGGGELVLSASPRFNRYHPCCAYSPPYHAPLPLWRNPRTIRHPFPHHGRYLMRVEFDTDLSKFQRRERFSAKSRAAICQFTKHMETESP